MLAEALEVALSDGEEDALGFDALLEIWKGQVDLAPDEPLMLTGPVFFWEREHAGIRGAIGITTHNVVFLPSSGPGAERAPFQFSLMDIRPQNPDDPINIHMETPRGAMHFTALTGHGFCEAFWMLSGQLITQEITAEIEETRAGQALSRVLGDVMYLCLFSDEHNLATMRPAHTFKHEDGLGLLLSGCEGIELNRGQPLVVEFAQPEGTYQFDTEVLRMGPVPISLQNRFKNVHDMVLLKAPLDLRFNNRRSGYRVHGYDRVEVEGMLANDEGQEIATTCFLEDLSIGGCGVSSHDYIQEGAGITLKLPLSEEREIHVQAICLRSEPPVDLGSPWQYGLEFADLSESNSDRINQELLRRQREELAEKTVDDEY
jgi:c-di-GMP-binding flagellar brake protein YcgR